VVIIAESNHHLARNIDKVSRIIRGGAAVCVSTNEYASLWLPVLSKKKLVILCGAVSWADLWISKKVPMIQISDWG
jgi:predicted phosphohydrolase